MDPDGWYRERPPRTLKEWKEKKKACGRNDDLLFCKQAVLVTRSKRKPKYKIQTWKPSSDQDSHTIIPRRKKVKKQQESTSRNIKM